MCRACSASSRISARVTKAMCSNGTLSTTRRTPTFGGVGPCFVFALKLPRRDQASSLQMCPVVLRPGARYSPRKPRPPSAPRATAVTRKNSKGNWWSPVLRHAGTVSSDPSASIAAFVTTRSAPPSVSAVFQASPSSLTRLPPELSSSSKAFLALSTAPLALSPPLHAIILRQLLGRLRRRLPPQRHHPAKY